MAVMVRRDDLTEIHLFHSFIAHLSDRRFFVKKESLPLASDADYLDLDIALLSRQKYTRKIIHWALESS